MGCRDSESPTGESIWGPLGETAPRRMQAALGRLILVLYLGITPVGCNCAGPAVETLNSGGHERSFQVVAPDLDGPLPLVVVLHGGGGITDGADAIRRTTRFDEKAEEAGFIAVFPYALYANWNDGRTGDALRENRENIDDFAFIDAILDRVIETHDVDESQIYLTGASNGGIFTLAMACHPVGARFAAIAPVIGSMAEGSLESCDPADTLPVLFINGDEDEFIPMEGGQVYRGNRGQVEPVEDAVRFWAAQNGCDSEPSQAEQDDIDDGTSLVIDTFGGCRDDSEVKRILINGGGHTWPGQREWLSLFLGTVSKELNATDEVWRFLSRFSR
jgi:polyhydroxybutyrate depolymerase